MLIRTKTCYCFQVHDKSQIIRKGIHSDIESYSAFWDNAKLNETNLRQDLINRNVNTVFICGIAYDHCVGEFNELSKFILPFLITISRYL